MKKIIFIFICATALLTLKTHAQNDIFPDYSSQPYSIAINLNLDSIRAYVDDPLHRFCDSIMYYTVTGMPPTTTNHWIAITGGTLDAASTNSPTALLCRMLHAYASGSTSNISALYRSQDIQLINSILSVDSINQRFIASIAIINKMDFIMSAQLGNYTVAFVKLYNAANQPLGTTYYYLTQVNNDWKFVATLDSVNSLPENLALYLNYYDPQSLLSNDDFDLDGIPNQQDNCPCIYNPNQQDMDHDGIGDPCDNCPITYNPTQIDSDLDGIGDDCDNCPSHYNPLQEDSDHDRLGDSCDNCPLIVNPRQIDVDHDSIGNECDPDIDGDGILNALDDDMDGDGIPNQDDNCPMHYNPSQYDSDNDGIGDACDCCPMVANPN